MARLDAESALVDLEDARDECAMSATQGCVGIISVESSYLRVETVGADGTAGSCELFAMQEHVDIIQQTDKNDEPHTVQETMDEFDRAHELTSSFPVQAAFILHRRYPLSDQDGNRLFALLDLDASRKITLDEVHYALNNRCSNEVHDLIWKFKDTPLAHLRNKRSLKFLFDKIDPGGQTGGISVQQWRTFLAEVMIHDHNHLRRKGLSTFRAFYGLGRGEQLSDIIIQASASDPLYGFINRAWLADYWYYEKNQHPLLSLFLADADNPLSVYDRLKIEFVVTSWNLFASTIVYQISGSTAMLYFLSFVIVSVPLNIMRSILLYLFTCPCLQIRNNHPGNCQRRCIGCCKGTGQCLGNLYLAGGVTFLVLGILTAIKFGAGFVNSWLFSWGASYLVCVCMDLCFQFNCIPLCLMLRESRVSILCLGLLQRFQLCQWLKEKNIVMRALKGDTASYKSEKSTAGSGRSYKYAGYTVTQVLPV